MFNRARKLFAGLIAVGALALGGSAIAGAASSNSTSTTTNSTGTTQAAPPAGRPRGPHVGANGKQEQALTGDVAAKVTAAAKAKEPNATILRVETDVDTGSPYEAHMQKSDGSQVVVYVDKDYNVTSVAAFGGPGGPGGPGAPQGAPSTSGSGA